MSSNYSALRQEIEALAAEGLAEPYLLFAMGLRLNTLDYETLAADCLLDGPDDKKIDFFNIDYDSGVALLAQGYYSEDWDKKHAPANKASDLGIAINWLLESDAETIPRESIRAAAVELRDALKSGEVTRLDIFYVHNLEPSDNVAAELATVQRAAERLLERYADDVGVPPDCSAREVSRALVDDWRKSQHEAISLQDEVEIRIVGEPLTQSTAEWRAAVVTIPATELVALRTKYGDALSSANVRDYLGSRQTTRNINKQIENTAVSEPGNFWIFNNGITLLTNGFTFKDEIVTLHGVAVINGAQTTGSLTQAASSAKEGLADATLLARIIRCNEPSLVDKVIRFNNTQNPIKAWELRVIDPIQRKLTADFERLDITYQTRRGVGRRRSSDVHYEKLGPFLAAFYGDPGAAHRNKADLFENEKRYRELFDDDTRVENLLFVYRLGNAVQAVKTSLKEKVTAGTATGDERSIYDYFRYGAFPLVLVYLCGEVLGLWLESTDPRYKRRVAMRRDLVKDDAATQEVLERLVNAVLLPVHQYFKAAEHDPYQTIRAQAGVDALKDHVRTLISAVEQMQPQNYDEIKSKVALMTPND